MNENENANTNAVEPLLKRVFIFLETEDWIKAGQYCERVLDMEPENARAYMGKLMAELHVRKQEDLSACEEPFDDYKNYKLALTYADEELKKTLEGYNKAAAERMEENRLAQSYQDGIHAMEEAVSEEDFHKAAQIFRSIINYKSAEELAEECDRGFEKRVAEADRIIERIRCSYTTMGFFHDKPHTEDHEDRIFILSKEELFQYFGHNFKQPPINKYCANVTRTDVWGWWLRDTAQCYDGAIKGGAAAVVTMPADRAPEIMYVLATQRCFVRPALWIDLSE